ncbi:MAG: hypothetical protein ACFFD1_12365 [Candidatus Thorarchaeota archaeon]
MPRRNDAKLVTEMVDYLKNLRVESLSQGDLCSSMNINSETASKWLNIILFLKENVPNFTIEKFGRYTIIRFVNKKPLFYISHDDSMKKGIEPNEVSNELKEKLSSKTLGLDPITTSKIDYKLKALLICTSCKLEIDFPNHCGFMMEFSEKQLICSICNKKMKIPQHCDVELGIKIKKVENNEKDYKKYL